MSQELSKDTLYHLMLIAELCKYSYKDPLNLQSCVTQTHHKPLLNTAVFISNSETDAQAYIFYTTKTIYICFRGTSSTKDKITDLRLLMVRFLDDKVYVHRGFYQQYMSISDNIKVHIQNIQKIYGQNCIITCGHSLGGALATICALELKNSTFYRTNIQCISFGSPRVGNKAFQELYKSMIKPCDGIKSYRITDHNDPIPYVPMNCYYHHIDNSICFYENKIIEKEEKKWYRRLIDALKNIKYRNMFSEHYMTNYIDLIRSAYERSL